MKWVWTVECWFDKNGISVFVKLRYFLCSLECGQAQKMAASRILILFSFFFLNVCTQFRMCALAHVWPPVGNLLSDSRQWNHKPHNADANTTEKKNGFQRFFSSTNSVFFVEKKIPMFIYFESFNLLHVSGGRLTVWGIRYSETVWQSLSLNLELEKFL